MPSYTQCSKDEATHLYNKDPSESTRVRGQTMRIVQKVEDGCLVRVMPDGPHSFVRHYHASYYKEYVPPVVTYGLGKYSQRHGLPALVMGTGRWATKDAAQACLRQINTMIDKSARFQPENFPKWTHVITYHDGKAVAIEELQ